MSFLLVVWFSVGNRALFRVPCSAAAFTSRSFPSGNSDTDSGFSAWGCLGGQAQAPKGQSADVLSVHDSL